MRLAQIEEEGREVGAARCHDLRTQAPQLSPSARQKHEERGKVGIVLVDRHGSVPRTTILTSCQSRRALARRRSRLRAAPTARRHGGCTSLPPNPTSVAAATIPLRGRHGWAALQLRVIALAGPRDLLVITERNTDDSSKASHFPPRSAAR